MSCMSCRKHIHTIANTCKPYARYIVIHANVIQRSCKELMLQKLSLWVFADLQKHDMLNAQITNTQNKIRKNKIWTPSRYSLSGFPVSNPWVAGSAKKVGHHSGLMGMPQLPPQCARQQRPFFFKCVPASCLPSSVQCKNRRRVTTQNKSEINKTKHSLPSVR